MARPPRDRAAGFVCYPNDWLNSPIFRGMGERGMGVFLVLYLSLWNQPEPGVVEDDDELLASLALCSIDVWKTVRVRVARAFDTTSRPGIWVLDAHFEGHRARQREYERTVGQRKQAGKASAESRKQSGNAKRGKGKATARSTTVQRAVDEPLNEPSTSRSTSRQPNVVTEDSSLRSESSNGEASPSVPSGEAGIAASPPLRSSEAAPSPETGTVDNSAPDGAAEPGAPAAPGSANHRNGTAPVQTVGLPNGKTLTPASELSRDFPNTAAWQWIKTELRPADQQAVIVFMRWAWKDGVEDMDLVKGMVERIRDEKIGAPYAYWAKDGTARNRLLEDATVSAHNQRKEDERQWLSNH